MEEYKQIIKTSQQHLTDKEYLNRYIENLYRFRPNEIWAIKDTNSIIIGGSQPSIKMHGFKNIENAIGKTHYDIPCKVVEYADELINQDKYTQQIKIPVTTLDIHQYHCGHKAIQSIREPIINPMTNEILGVIAYGQPIKLTHALKTVLDIHQIRFGKHNIMNINKSSEPKLTEIECNVVFCICLGINSRKDIAFLLSTIHKKPISATTTINDAFRRLYEKTNCNTPTQLLEFALFNKLHLQIPPNFLPCGSFILGHNQIW